MLIFHIAPDSCLHTRLKSIRRPALSRRNWRLEASPSHRRVSAGSGDVIFRMSVDAEKKRTPCFQDASRTSGACRPQPVCWLSGPGHTDCAPKSKLSSPQENSALPQPPASSLRGERPHGRWNHRRLALGCCDDFWLLTLAPHTHRQSFLLELKRVHYRLILPPATSSPLL